MILIFESGGIIALLKVIKLLFFVTNFIFPAQFLNIWNLKICYTHSCKRHPTLGLNVKVLFFLIIIYFGRTMVFFIKIIIQNNFVHRKWDLIFLFLFIFLFLALLQNISFVKTSPRKIEISNICLSKLHVNMIKWVWSNYIYRLHSQIYS